MIEFAYLMAGGTTETRATTIINANNVAQFDPIMGVEDRCRVVLNDGRQLIAAHSYRDLRRALIQSRSGFSTLVAP